MHESKTKVWGMPVARLAFAGALLMWLAQPPLAWAPVAFVALIPWGLLVLRGQTLERRGWFYLWLAGVVYWLATMQGVRLAHPALYLGWFVLAAYLGCYPMVAVALGRVVVHRWKVPIWIGFPVVWAGMEVVRSYAFTGFSAALLGHSLADWSWMIQIADLGGTYFVSFVLATVASVIVAVIGDLRRDDSGRRRFRPGTATGAAFGTVTIAATLGYGYWRVTETDAIRQADPMVRVILIQRDEPLEFTLDPSKEVGVYQRYVESTIDAIRRHPTANLIVWPESMYTAGYPYRMIADGVQVPDSLQHPNEARPLTLDEFTQLINFQEEMFSQRAAQLKSMIDQYADDAVDPQLLVGCSVYRYGPTPEVYGAAVHIDQQGDVAGWYGKMHLVMFGEYIPFGDYFPWLYKMGPLQQGATPGPGPRIMDFGGIRVAPSICFETMVEQVTGNGLRRLRREGKPPQLIVNLTNDAWFHGSSILTHHRRCSQLVAVANRLPMLVAANQGPTTWIDGAGRRVDSLDYQTNAALFAEPRSDGRTSLYAMIGDKASWPFAIVCIVASGALLMRRRTA
jgi:apolipoprotein N-acyltransferase